MSEAIACCGPLSAPVLTDEEAAATASSLRALGDPARVRIVNVLATVGGEVCGRESTGPSAWRSRPSPTA